MSAPPSPDLDRLMLMVGTPVVTATSAAGVVTDEHIGLLAMIIGVSTVIAGLIAWIDSRIEKKTNAQTRLLMREISHLRHELAVKLKAPEIAIGPEDAA